MPVHRQTGWIEWRDIALANGITYHCFVTRVRRLGWSEKQAAYFPKQRMTAEEEETLRQYGISKSNFHNRLKLGWDRERALTTPVKKKRGHL